MVGGHSPLPSKSRAGLWAHLQPPGLSALARSLCFLGGGGGPSWRKARTVLPPGGLLWQHHSLHRKIPLDGLLTFLPTPPPSDWTHGSWFSLPGTSPAILGLGFPAGKGHAPPTRELSPGPRWPRCGFGSQPWRPRLLPLTAPTAPSPSSPWLPPHPACPVSRPPQPATARRNQHSP